MFYACLATCICFSIGLGGIVLSFIDIERWNFGLYFALLSVVGTTVSVAFWIISPSICKNPKWVQWLLDRYGHKVEPCQNWLFRFCNRDRRRFWEDEDSSITAVSAPEHSRTRRTRDSLNRKKVPLYRAWTMQARSAAGRKGNRTFSVRALRKQPGHRGSISLSASGQIMLPESSGQNCTDVEIV